MKKTTLFILFFLLVQLLRSEEIYFPELHNLFESDLVVDASYMRIDGPDYFYIKINEVIKGEKFGLKKGDYLRLRQLKHDGCGGPIYHHNYKRNRYYLKKSNIGWMINHGTAQSIQSINAFAGISNQIDYYMDEPPTMNATIKQFLLCYRLNEEENEYQILVSEEELKEISKENILVSNFERSYRTSLDATIVEPPMMEIQLEEKRHLPIIDCALMSTPAEYPFTKEELTQFLLKNDNPLWEMGIEGRVYVKCIIDKEGNTSQIEVVRGVSPKLDTIAANKMRNMPKWKAAVNQYGENQGCSTVLPFTFKAEKSEL